ncbi:glycosyltransferase [Marinimicrobium sp. LS-A18]|uniref:glycosyltransferase n=1 Tax=Marinimicrobium sp. LS-A18 TaxID=1381596 RepID=UPI000465418B|nr:glycosyltransferase [Marinimicrobium sp. LS-A18]
MKVAILVDSLSSIAAGSERQIYKLTEGLVEKGHDVRLILLRHTEFSRKSLKLSCTVECVYAHKLLSFEVTKKMLRLRASLINDGVGLVHAFFPDACLLAPLYLKHPLLKIVTSRRDMGLIYQGKPAWLYRILGFRTDAVVSNSVAVSNLVSEKERIAENKRIVIYNGIEPYNAEFGLKTDQLYRRESSVKLILVANIKPVKRTFDSVVALHKMVSEGKDVELALVGKVQDPDYAQNIKSYVERYHLEGNVRWSGQVDEPRRFLKQADIGLLISESEGFSNTLMEYLQQGLASVATSVGGNPELIENGKTGFLIDPGNTEQLVNSVECLAQNSTLRKEVADKGKEMIDRKFSVGAMLKNHEALYENILGCTKEGRVHVEH